MCFSIEVEKELKKLAKRFNAQISAEEFFKLQDLLKNYPKLGFKTPAQDGRVFPNYFAPVIRSIENQRVIYPMRYRVRPQGSKEEIPTKFNVFNARLDSLESRQTWQPLLGKKHGLVSIKKFYEWVPDENNKTKLISFFPADQELMCSPCLFDSWQSPDGKISYLSFAIITTDPPPEVLQMGHDRCPIFLREERIDDWLNEKNKKAAINLLSEAHPKRYDYAWP